MEICRSILLRGLVLVSAMVIATSAQAMAQPAKTVAFTGSDEEIGALIAWSVPRAASERWYHGGADAAQDVFVTELVSTGSIKVIDPEKLRRILFELSNKHKGEIDDAAAVTFGKRLEVRYLLVASVTEYGASEGTATVAVGGRLIDTSTGEIVWADEAKVSVGGFGGGVDDDRMLADVVTPALRQLVTKLASVGK